MNRKELVEVGRAMFGPHWKLATAAFLNVNRRTISRWIAADLVPEGPATSLRNAPALRVIQRAREWREAVRDFEQAPTDGMGETERTRALDRLEQAIEEAEQALIATVDELESVFPQHVGELVDAHLGAKEDA